MEPEKQVELYVAKLGVPAIRLAIKEYGRDRVVDDIVAGLLKAINRIEDGDNREVVELVGVIHLEEQTHEQDKVEPAQGV